MRAAASAFYRLFRRRGARRRRTHAPPQTQVRPLPGEGAGDEREPDVHAAAGAHQREDARDPHRLAGRGASCAWAGWLPLWWQRAFEFGVTGTLVVVLPESERFN